ncbi:MAG: hypothetical protein WCG80_00640 [Spirochaetales bacterium]
MRAVVGLAWALSAWGLSAQSDDTVRHYLAQATARGLPLLAATEPKDQVPFWPELELELAVRTSNSPGADTALVEAWSLLQQDRIKEASGVLEGLWSSPPSGSSTLPITLRAEAWFSTLRLLAQDEKLTAAWKAWEQKYLSPSVIETGLESLERTQPSSVVGVLKQAMELYPQDRRWLVWLLRHPKELSQTLALVQRDRVLGGGFSPTELRAILRRNPASRELLLKAGYAATSLDASLTWDYATLASKPVEAATGTYFWDINIDGLTDSRVVMSGGHLQVWSQGLGDPEGQSWSISFAKGKPVQWQEGVRSARWTLDYEDYPYARTLTYTYATHEIQYQFPPFSVAVRLAPDERFQGPEVLWPWELDKSRQPLSLPSLVLQASSILNREAGLVRSTVSLASGAVWLTVDDADSDGRADTWSFFRQGKLDRVYRNPSGEGAAATLQELYSKGDFQAFLADPARSGRTMFALFPEQQVQLWDPEGTGTPWLQLANWGSERVEAAAFSGETIPWATMPVWESRP